MRYSYELQTGGGKLLPVRVDYLSMIMAVTETKSEQIELNREISVKQLIEQLAEKYGPGFKKFFWDTKGQWHPQAIVNLNSKLVRDFQETVAPGAVILIAPLVAGG